MDLLEKRLRAKCLPIVQGKVLHLVDSCKKERQRLVKQTLEHQELQDYVLQKQNRLNEVVEQLQTTMAAHLSNHDRIHSLRREACFSLVIFILTPSSL